jgi:hypothetical protein
VLVVLVGFFVLGLLAYRTYQAPPPVPAQVVGADGDVLFTGKDISRGQQVFLHNGRLRRLHTVCPCKPAGSTPISALVDASRLRGDAPEAANPSAWAPPSAGV